jgi:hypothetical protein
MFRLLFVYLLDVAMLVAIGDPTCLLLGILALTAGTLAGLLIPKYYRIAPRSLVLRDEADRATARPWNKAA